MSPLNSTFTSKRLRIEPLEPDHASPLFDVLQDPAIYTWISGAPPQSVSSLREWIERLNARRALPHDELWLAWSVHLRDGTCIGKADANLLGEVATNVGYVLSSPHWGKGYGTELVCALVEHLAQHGITRWTATVTVGNIASARLLERAGFLYTRTLPDNDTIRGVLYDDWEYVRTTTS